MPVHQNDLPGTTPNKPAPEDKQQVEVDKVNDKDAAVLSAAAASGDADVHNLLAHRAIAELNQDAEAIKAIDKQLAERHKV